ncbi:hypothetical protein [Mycobacterium tuberculosis]
MSKKNEVNKKKMTRRVGKFREMREIDGQPLKAFQKESEGSNLKRMPNKTDN